MLKPNNNSFTESMVECLKDLGYYLEPKEKELAEILLVIPKNCTHGQFKARYKYLHCIRNILLYRLKASKVYRAEELAEMFNLTKLSVYSFTNKNSYDYDLERLSKAYAVYLNPLPVISAKLKRELGDDPLTLLSSKICYYADCIATL